MKQRILTLLTASLVLIAVLLGLGSCGLGGDPVKLEAPKLTLAGNVASWEAQEGAKGYEIDINEKLLSRGADVTSVVLNDGETVKVRAIGDGRNYLSSEWSNAVTFNASACSVHIDTDDNGKCDGCGVTVVAIIDFYVMNDLHGKFCDTDGQPGVDELASYLKGRENIDDNVVVLSSGDMWQGTAESGLTYGKIMTEWMNIVGTVSMTLGNHEYDWGEEYIRENLEIAYFPFLAINIYDLSTGARADYCTPSILIEEGGIQIGIIGAIGDCYSSILSDMVSGVEFKTGSALTALVKAESERLRDQGADIIVYSIHDGTNGYDNTLSIGGYVDIVFEGHTHASYCTKDAFGVYHIQAGGENKGISHAEVKVNSASGKITVTAADVISSSVYSACEDDPETEALEEKYRDIIELATRTLGRNDTKLSDSEVEDIIARLYYALGVETWGDEYSIALGGGYLKTRSPYDLAAGAVTYGDLMSLLPFNNELVLCSISGANLKSRFIETTNSDYHCYYTLSASDIDPSATYYVVVDTYTAAYASNRLTVIERYGEGTYARDLLAEFIESGALEKNHNACEIKTVSELLSIGASLSLGATSTATYHLTGTVSYISNSTYGNLYLTDGDGNSIYVYGLSDRDGNRYDAMATKPVVGDLITICAKIQNYNNSGASLIELKDAVIIIAAEEPPASEATALAAPVITLDGSTLKWTPVPGAVGYEILIDGVAGTILSASTREYALSASGEIRVRALADPDSTEYLNSEWSAPLYYDAGIGGGCTSHADSDNNGKCDECGITVIVVVDFYAINDLHGKFCDTDRQPGVDELASYLKGRENIDDNVVVLSSGDMWQGTAESGLTYGQIMTEWMNIVGTVSMTLGNHEYDWGEDYIKQNLAVADFPFLAINIYDLSTGARADYCTPSILIDEGGIQIGIIGAIGDCYSSILSDMVTGVEFKTGSALTALVKAESERLRNLGADIIVYSIHDGTSGYDYSLSSGGYVDVVFEGHTHSAYCTEDSYGVFHIQAGGENNGISHAELSLNIANGILTVTTARVIPSSEYAAYEDDPETEALEEKYRDIIELATSTLGTLSSGLSDSQVEDIVAELYYKAGVEKWGASYNIVLGGGFLKTRSPYSLSAGEVTYGDLMSLLPFNNELVLCSISGTNLKSKFINSTSSDYHCYYTISASAINANATYYVIVDSYTASYAPNNLTEIDRYGESIYARDLLAEYIKAGNLGSGSSGGSGGSDPVLPDTPSDTHSSHATKTIVEALSIGSALTLGSTTSDTYHVTGVIESISSTTYGNLYLTDGSGNRIWVYGVYDENGNRYEYMTTKPQVGDTVTLCAPIMNYNDGGTSKVELKGAILVSIN